MEIAKKKSEIARLDNEEGEENKEEDAALEAEIAAAEAAENQRMQDSMKEARAKAAALAEERRATIKA